MVLLNSNNNYMDNSITAYSKMNLVLRELKRVLIDICERRLQWIFTKQ